MSDQTQKYVFGLWTLIDVILNSVLFLLIGLEALIMRFDSKALILAGVAVPIALLARLVAVSTPPAVFAWTGLMSWSNVPFLTWAGVRGGISVALALSVPESSAKPAILAATYAVVLFSIVIQAPPYQWSRAHRPHWGFTKYPIDSAKLTVAAAKLLGSISQHQDNTFDQRSLPYSLSSMDCQNQTETRALRIAASSCIS